MYLLVRGCLTQLILLQFNLHSTLYDWQSVHQTVVGSKDLQPPVALSDAVESVPAVCTDDCNVCINRNLIELITDIAGRVRDNSKLVQHLEVINTMKKPMYINIYKSSPPPDLDLLDEA